MNKTLAVISQSGESLSFFDLSSGQKTGHLTDLIPEPHELCYDDRTDFFYITHAYKHGWYVVHGEDGHQISVVDCKQRKVVDVLDTSPGKGPHYSLLDKKNDLLYVCVEGGLADEDKAGGIIGIDLKTKKVVKTIRSGWKSHWFVMTPDCRKAYTCNKDASFVSVIDLVEDRMIAKIAMPEGCEQPSISRDGRHVYYPTPTIGVSMKKGGGPYAVQVVDTTEDRVVKTLPLELGALTTHVDALDRLLVGQYRFDMSTTPPTPQNGQLLVLAGHDEDYRELGRMEVGKASLTLFSTPDGSKAFAANQWSGTVSVVDMTELAVERTLEVDMVVAKGKDALTGAHGMAIIP